MGLFSKRPRSDSRSPALATRPPSAVDDVQAGDHLVSEDHTGRPMSRPLTDDERARIDGSLERLTGQGVAVDDLDAVGAAYDAAYRQWRDDPRSGDSADLVETYAVAIGEHIARASAREWAVVTDVFGTDLGLVAAGAETVVVPHNLVGARWMRGETGWVPRVVSHLVALRPRA